MSGAQGSPQQIPPEVARYIKGATAESLQFGFLIGKWDAEGSRYDAEGKVQLKYAAKWNAEYLHDRRMIFDDFTIQAPSGQEVSSFVTLRTYCETTGRWEITGLAPLQPAMNAKWFGHWSDDEMLLSAQAVGPDGKTVLNKIRFHDIQQARFSWESHNSYDDGKSWIRISSLVAHRKN
jgi:hypothetical protein